MTAARFSVVEVVVAVERRDGTLEHVAVAGAFDEIGTPAGAVAVGRAIGQMVGEGLERRFRLGPPAEGAAA